MHFVNYLGLYESWLGKTALSHQKLCIVKPTACLLAILKNAEAADIDMHVDIGGEWGAHIYQIFIFTFVLHQDPIQLISKLLHFGAIICKLRMFLLDFLKNLFGSSLLLAFFQVELIEGWLLVGYALNVLPESSWVSRNGCWHFSRIVVVAQVNFDESVGIVHFEEHVLADFTVCAIGQQRIFDIL